jgi:hypothetical protein
VLLFPAKVGPVLDKFMVEVPALNVNPVALVAKETGEVPDNVTVEAFKLRAFVPVDKPMLCAVNE